MSAFSKSLAAVQAFTTYLYGPYARVMFVCDLDRPIDPERGVADPEGWRCWIALDGELTVAASDLYGRANTGAGALDDLLAKLRARTRAPAGICCPTSVLAKSVHAITCARCGVFRAQQDGGDVCACGARRGED